MFEAPGDVKLERLPVHNEIASGNWLVQECIFEGTHEDTLSSPNGEIPATHKRVNGRCVQILEVAGDVITDTRLYFDQVQIMTQLGLMPEPAIA